MMRRPQRSVVALLMGIALTLGATACKAGQTEVKPPEIRYGQDVCAACNMIISDARYASAYVYAVETGRYDSLVFDDIGDMVLHAADHPEHKFAAWYVHDYNSEAWLDATTAHYVFSAELQTPMAHGMAAHATAEAAEKMAAELHGDVLDWVAAKARLAKPRA